MAVTAQTQTDQTLLSALAAIVGPEHATDDPVERDVFSQDIFSRAPFSAEMVVAPGDLGELSRVVATATAAGRAVFPRGGGASYTGGYLPSVAHSVVIDLRRMHRVLEINGEDRYVRVEPGITWIDLDNALRNHGLRTPFWGVQSGRLSTVGGAMAQHAAYYGSGTHGPSAESVKSLAVVLADGQVLRTGSAAIDGNAPFYRYFGPDLAGLFLGDNGSLGIKGEITLRLVPRAEHEDYLSASFADFASAAAAMSDVARLGVVADGFLMDPGLQAARMKRVSFAQDLKTLAGIAKNAGGIGKGLKAATRVVTAGRKFIDAQDFSLHLSIEHRYREAVDAALREVGEACERHGGRIIENSVPKAVRGNPFGPLNIVIGTDGKRWIPTHGLVPHSRAVAVQAEINSIFERHGTALEEHGVEPSLLATTVGNSTFLIEPIMSWPDEMLPMHERLMEPSYRKLISPLPENAQAGALVAQLRGEIKEVFVRHGGTNMQLGRSYPFRERIGAVNWALLKAVKAEVDPNMLMNPGALGLGTDA
jgi:D-lactate dehydrogenase (cytochrome)